MASHRALSVAMAAVVAAAIAVAHAADAAYGRIGAAPVVASDVWLVLGGSPLADAAGSNETLANAVSAAAATYVAVPLSSPAAPTEHTSESTTTKGLTTVSATLWTNATGHSCTFHSGSELVYCIGGRHIAETVNSTRTYLSGVGVLDHSEGKWLGSASCNVAERHGAGSVLIGDDWYIFGGGLQDGSVDATLRTVSLPTSRLALTSSLEAKTISPSTSTTPDGRMYACMAPVNSTSFVLIGGLSADSEPIADVWVYNTDTSAWTDVTQRLFAGGLNSTLLERTGAGCASARNAVWLFGGSVSSPIIQLYNDVWKLDMNSFTASEVYAGNVQDSTLASEMRANAASLNIISKQSVVQPHALSASKLVLTKSKLALTTDSLVDMNLQAPVVEQETINALDNLDIKLTTGVSSKAVFSASTLSAKRTSLSGGLSFTSLSKFKRDVTVSSSSDGPSGRSYPVIQSFEGYFAIYGGENYFDTTSGQWVSNDDSIHYFDQSKSAWVVDTSKLSTLKTVNFSDSDDDNNRNITAVIVVASVLGVVILGLCIYAIILCRRKRRKQKQERRSSKVIFDSFAPPEKEPMLPETTTQVQPQDSRVSRYFTPLEDFNSTLDRLDAENARASHIARAHKSLSLRGASDINSACGKRNSYSIGDIVKTNSTIIEMPTAALSPLSEDVTRKDQLKNPVIVPAGSIAALIGATLSSDSASMRSHRSVGWSKNDDSRQNKFGSKRSSMRNMSPDGFSRRSPMREAIPESEDKIMDDIGAVFAQSEGDSPALIALPAKGEDSRSQRRAGSTRSSVYPPTTSTVAVAGASTRNKRLFKVLWAHEPVQSDEIGVQPGDIVEEVRSFADGWSMVVNKSQRDARGMVPKNILKEYVPKTRTDSEPPTNAFASRAPSTISKIL